MSVSIYENGAAGRAYFLAVQEMNKRWNAEDDARQSAAQRFLDLTKQQPPAPPKQEPADAN